MEFRNGIESVSFLIIVRVFDFVLDDKTLIDSIFFFLSDGSVSILFFKSKILRRTCSEFTLVGSRKLSLRRNFNYHYYMGLIIFSSFLSF